MTPKSRAMTAEIKKAEAFKPIANHFVVMLDNSPYCHAANGKSKPRIVLGRTPQQMSKQEADQLALYQWDKFNGKTRTASVILAADWKKLRLLEATKTCLELWGTTVKQ
jgi:hypothetical protein